MDVVVITTFVFLLTVVRSHDVKESKACYGAKGNQCTTHSLECQDDKITILDAFYSNNSNCSSNGASACSTGIFQNYTVRLGELNQTDTDDLYTNCSLQRRCDYQAPRNDTITFSVVKYMCIKESRNICDGNAFGDHKTSLLWNKTSHMNESYTCSCNISSKDTEPTAVYALDMRPRSACIKLTIAKDGQTYKNCTQNIQYQLLANTTWTIILEPVDVFDILWINIRGNFEVNCRKKISPTTTTSTTTSTTAQNTGAIAGGVIGVLVVGVIVAAILLWVKLVRNKKKDKKPEKEGSNHVFAGSLSRRTIQERGHRNLQAVSNFNYATIHDGANPVGRQQNDYVLAGKPNTENGTVMMEDDYNHINQNPKQGASSNRYHTTASASATVNKLKNAFSNSIDDDDYNHLGEGKPSVVSSDYDTTLSATKAVAQFGEMKDSEDDHYDHFKVSENRVIDSPYDTAYHQSSVSADTATSPYDLAK